MTNLQHLPPDYPQRCAAYRTALEQAYATGTVDAAGRGCLEAERQRIGLHPADAQQLEQEYMREHAPILIERAQRRIETLEHQVWQHKQREREQRERDQQASSHRTKNDTAAPHTRESTGTNTVQGNNKLNKAIAAMSAALAIDPDDPVTYVRRADLYYKTGNYDRAFQDYNAAIALQADLAEAYYGRGLIYANNGNYDQAIQEYDRAIAIQPYYPGAYYNRGNAYYNKGHTKKAISNYNDAITLQDNHAYAYFARGHIYKKLQYIEQAIADFSKYLELDQNPDMRRVAEQHLRELKLSEQNSTRRRSNKR